MTQTVEKPKGTMPSEVRKSASDAAKSRNQYPQEVKDLVLLKYPRCRTIEDKWALAYEVADLMGIPKDDPNLLQKLYNLASRIKATRRHRTTAEEWTSEDELRYDPSTDRARLEIRDDPETLEWTKGDERYLKQNWKIYKIEDIAFQLNRSETAVAYRARKLGLRQVAKYYDMEKVGPWLGLTQKDMINLQEKGLELKPCTDYRGEYKLTLVSAASLYRLLRNEKLRTFLIQNRRADRFFIMDVIESMEGVIATHTKRVFEQKKTEGKKLTAEETKQLAAAKAKIREIGRELDFEVNDWVSHGHTCLCPYSEYTLGTRFDGTDTETTGYELKPDELHPDKKVGTAEWRREYWGGRKQIAG